MNSNRTANHTKSFFHKTGRAFRKYFIAHEENDHHPHIFRAKAVLVFFACLFAIEGSLFLYAGRSVQTDSQKAAVIAQALVSYTNDARASENLAPLVRNSLLDLAAQKKAEDMIAKGYFAHFAPDGTSPWHWIDAVGYEYASAGENLAIDFFDSKDVVGAWMNSPGHRKNIMKQKYAEIGMAVADGTFENRHTTFVVQFFATPAGIAAAAPAIIPVVTATTTPSATSSVLAAAAATTSTSSSISAGISSSTATTMAIATTTATGTPLVKASVAGISTDGEDAPGLFERMTREMFGFAASPRNAVETVLFTLMAFVLVATLLYVHGSKNPAVHRKVAFVSISLLITLTLLVMMNRTFLRMTEDSIGPSDEISLEIDSR